ncbi:MAG: CPBP family intramembrane metalloprotease [Propionibacteriaceae bacterium]|jgi:membrane protease YdiL (CAAX protease family)|nr:CPBP family intramembrane metalloprotease [Propionibacteriaceae bacterium]
MTEQPPQPQPYPYQPPQPAQGQPQPYPYQPPAQPYQPPAQPDPYQAPAPQYSYPPQAPYPPVPPAYYPPAKPPELPVEPMVYAQFFRTPRFAPWKAVLAGVLGVVGYLAASMLLAIVWTVYALSTGEVTMESLMNLDYANIASPSFFLINNLSLVACIGVAMLLGLAFFGQKPRWLASIEGKFRWGFLGWSLLIAVPLYVAFNLVDFFLAEDVELAWMPHTVPMILIILLTTPLQCAGEEYLFRGLINRSFGSLPKGRTAGMVCGFAVSAVVFAAAHMATDIWLISFYLLFSAVGCLLTWKTGGLEAAIAIHVANNLVSMWTVPFSDFSGLFDRSAGAGSPLMLAQAAVMALATALILLLAKRKNLPVEAAPGAVAAMPRQEGV